MVPEKVQRYRQVLFVGLSQGQQGCEMRTLWQGHAALEKRQVSRKELRRVREQMLELRRNIFSVHEDWTVFLAPLEESKILKNSVLKIVTQKSMKCMLHEFMNDVIVHILICILCPCKVNMLISQNILTKHNRSFR